MRPPHRKLHKWILWKLETIGLPLTANKYTYNPWLNMLYYLEQMEGCEVSQHSDLLNDLNNKRLTKMPMNLGFWHTCSQWPLRILYYRFNMLKFSLSARISLSSLPSMRLHNNVFFSFLLQLKNPHLIILQAAKFVYFMRIMWIQIWGFIDSFSIWFTTSTSPVWSSNPLVISTNGTKFIHWAAYFNP